MERYKDTSLSFEERVTDLMSRMTRKEKLMIIIETSPANEKLGIPKYYHGNEALHGIVRPGKFTVFPQAIALGSSFDEKLIHDIADAASDEARARYYHGKGKDVSEELYEGRYNGLLTFWSPDLNLARDPRWGRTAETYGEDPYLAGRLGIAFVRGLQGDDPKYLKAVSTPKHFTANNEERKRFSCNAKMPVKTLHEYHLVPFEMAVKEGKCAAVMAAYNAINGIPCHMNKELLTDILRGEWGFKGYTVSDCSGIARIWDSHHIYDDPADAASAALNAGIDLECGSYSPYEHFYATFIDGQAEAGKTTDERIDEACRRVLYARFKLGQFDRPEDVPFSKIPLSIIGCEEHQKLAYTAAAKSMVLLKNNGILPLNKNTRIAVVGNNADICQFGDYSGVPMRVPVSPLEGISSEAGGNCTFVKWKANRSSDSFAAVESRFLTTDKGENGLTGCYYNNTAFIGCPKIRRDDMIRFAWRDSMPDSFIDTPQYAIRWNGYITSPVSGLVMLRLSYEGNASCERPVLTFEGKDMGTEAAIVMESGKPYPISVEYRKSEEDPRISLEWILPQNDGEDIFADECAAASRAEAVIAVVGLGTNFEREGQDRDTLNLPPEQEELLHRLYDVNKNLIVILENGTPLTIPWVQEHAAAVIEAWYPGEAGGTAIADLLYGNINPSGRLCVSFPYSTDDIPMMNDYDNEHGRTYQYLKHEPLYPFGFGLSYTSYKYENPVITKTDGAFDVSFSLANTGLCDGEEVVQLYIDSAGMEHQPRYRLVRFVRVPLKKGETKKISFNLLESDFSLFTAEGKRRLFSGTYTLYIGGSQPDERSRTLGAPSFVSVKAEII